MNVKRKENDMSHISSTSRWDASASKWDAALVPLSIAVGSFVIIGVLWMTGISNRIGMTTKRSLKQFSVV
jgi:hypothetical protein